MQRLEKSVLQKTVFAEFDVFRNAVLNNLIPLKTFAANEVKTILFSRTGFSRGECMFSGTIHVYPYWVLNSCHTSILTVVISFIYSDVVLVCITICNTSQRLCTRFVMMSSNGNIFRVTGHLCGEFTGPGEFPAQRPVTRSFDVFFDLRLNKRSSKQPWG